MFTLNDDLSIYATRGDIVFFSVSAQEDGVPYKFQAGDVVRIKVYGKKGAEKVVLQKDFPVLEEAESVEIFLSEEDTKIDEVISKPKDYWYEVELNPNTNPQTIIGYDEDGAKVFKLFPEGDDIPEFVPDPEDFKVMDDELDMTSTRPVQNQAVARAVVALRADFEETKEDVKERCDTAVEAIERANGDIAVERARIDNLVAGATPDGAEVMDVRVGTDGTVYPSAGAAVRGQINSFSKVSENLYNAETDVSGYVIGEQGEIKESNNFKYSDLIEIGTGVTFTLKSAKVHNGTDGATYLIKYYKNPDTGTVVFNGRVSVYGDESYTAIAEGYNMIRVVSNKNAEPYMVNIGDELLHYTPFGVRVVYRWCVEYAFADELKQIQKNTEDIANNAFAIDAWVDITDTVESGGVVNSGNTGTTVAFDTVVSAGWKHAIIPCLKNDRFQVTGTCGDKYRLWCFTDAEGVVLSKSAGSITMDSVEIKAPADGFLVLNFSAGGDCAVRKCPTLTDTANSAEWSKLAVSGVLGRSGAGCYPFGVGIDCNYETPEIEALEVPEDRLSYFYGLYDELAERYPEYITKVDCDAEARDAGIEAPDYMNGYPIYMYKFAPAYAPSSGNIDATETAASKLKVFIVSGTHPEYMSMFDLYHTMRLVCEKWAEDENLDALRWECEFYVMPCSGPYGVQHASRTNYNGVNLNRNMPTKNWVPIGAGTEEYSGDTAASEYETKVLVHYYDLIAPHIFIDHHNTNVGSHKNLMYITSALQSCVDIGANHISTMTRRWKKRYYDVFPMDGVIYGFSKFTEEKGTRSEYACENGAFGFTYESQEAVVYSNGVLDADKAQKRTALCSTLATDGLLNFLLKVLKTLSAKII